MSPKINKTEQNYIPSKPFTFDPEPDLIVKVHEDAKCIHIHDYPVQTEEENDISHQLSVELSVNQDRELAIYIYTSNGDTITEMKIPTNLSRI